jgi:hypothetical protein
MESSTSTGQLEPAVEPASTDVVTPKNVVTPPDAASRAGAGTPPSEPTTEVHPTMVASIREQCSACAAPMAPDQRYCVECGQRRGPARVAQLDGLAQRSREVAIERRPSRRPRMSVNSTLIAGIGTLLLAMGVGVLIGRSGNTSAKAPPAQVVTVAGGGGSAATATTGAATPSPSAGATTTTKSAATAGAKSASKAAAAAPVKTVKVGSTGNGAGYQKGHFTGNFFGPEAEK